ncbi:DUF952 domain-containing protein [Nocardioides sp.]|uniref:DUF952 domain-containing protein n=1 Tax=Nocardioides sp. TaxID=35761 RepID=UPI00352905D3
MEIFHIATAADWEAARRAGRYTTSTLGRTLDEEGFLHASYRQQVPTVFGRYYRDAGVPLVLLTIDTERLEVPWREEAVDDGAGGEARYPHIYGPLDPAAVVRAQELTRDGGTGSFTTLFFQEMLVRVFLALGAMLLIALGVTLGRRADAAWAPGAGALAGLLVGGSAWWLVMRRR